MPSISRVAARPVAPAIWGLPLIVIATVLAGLLVARYPQAALALAALPLLLATLESAYVRLLVVVLGGVLVLDSSSGLGYVKLLYLLGFVLCLAGGWQSCVTSMRGGQAATVRRTVGWAWCVMMGVVAISFPIAALNGHSLALWLRVVAPYVLLAAVPILAADAAQRISTRFLAGAFVLTGLLGAASIGVELLFLRGLAALPLEGLFFTGLLLPVGLYAYACARSLRRGGQRGELLRWGWVAVAILAVLLVTGSRIGLLLLVAPLAMLALTGGLASLRRTIALGAVGVALVLGAFTVAGGAGVATEVAQTRLASIEDVLQAPAEDRSLADRLAQTRLSWELLKDAPLTGVGPGYVFGWYNKSGIFRESFTTDAALSMLAKFGLLGAAGLLAFLIMIGKLVRLTAGRTELAALVGFTAVIIPYLLLGNPFEDKGLAFALLFLLAFALKGRETVCGAATGSSP